MAGQGPRTRGEVGAGMEARGPGRRPAGVQVCGSSPEEEAGLEGPAPAEAKRWESTAPRGEGGSGTGEEAAWGPPAQREAGRWVGLQTLGR